MGKMTGVVKKRLVFVFTSVIGAAYLLFLAVILLPVHPKLIGNPPFGLPHLVLISVPGALLLSYSISNFLVKHGIKPLVEFCEFQGKLLANSSYDLRTPLTSIRGNLEVSLRKDRTVDEYKEAITLSLQETDRAIDSLKSLHRLLSSKLKPLERFHEQVDLRKILTERIYAYMPRIRARNITLEFSENAEIICACDENLMRQTIGNLLDKAVKYSPEGGVIKISTCSNGKNAYLRIANTYRVTGNEEMKKFSEEFWKDEGVSDKTIESSGLGLYIARYVVRSHRGDLKVHVTDDNLFSVAISLPLH
jgi:signal transduction histidine kinase